MISRLLWVIMSENRNLEDLVRYENISNHGAKGYLMNIQYDFYRSVTSPEPAYDFYMRLKAVPGKVSEKIRPVIRTYKNMFTHPSVFVKGGVKLFSDFYSNISSKIRSEDGKYTEIELRERNEATAYFISLIAGFAGTICGTRILCDLGVDGRIAASVGAPVAGYVLSMSSLVGSYMVLSKDDVKKKIKDSTDVVLALTPPTLIGALAGAPILGGIVNLGVDPGLVVGVNSTLGIITYAGIAGAAINSDSLLEKKK